MDMKWPIIALIAFLLIIAGATLGEQYINRLPDQSGNSVKVPEEVTFFKCTFVDEKGRPVDVVVLVSKEDIPLLMQGHRWGVLINTDDPRWNLND